LIGRILKDIYTIPAGPKDRLYGTIRKHMTLQELWSGFKDLRAVMKI
jgi:electron transfer flavoprotein-quinone oxidoreductase